MITAHPFDLSGSGVSGAPNTLIFVDGLSDKKAGSGALPGPAPAGCLLPIFLV